MKNKREKPIPESKIKLVKDLAELIKKKNTTLFASIKNLPASQFQEISKKLRGKAIIKVPRKNLFYRAIDKSGVENAEKLKEQYKESYALLFSDLDSYDLALELVKNKSPAKAKAGQEAPEDIVIQAGPTDLPPGPAISELGAVGLKIQIDKGKISIKESKTIVRAGEKISSAAADIMAKLDIKPFSIGFVPVSSLDNKEKKIYLNIKIDREETVKELTNAFGRALPFAVGIGYANEQTISFIIGKAGIYEKALSALINSNQTPEENKSLGEEK